MAIEQYALIVHLTTVFLLGATVIGTDILGLAWLLGKAATLPHRVMRTLHRLVWGGLILMLLSGGTMFLSYRAYLVTVPAFYIKITFITALVVNAFFIGRHMSIASTRSFASLTRAERLPLVLSGAVSTIAWVGTISAALMLGL